MFSAITCVIIFQVSTGKKDLPAEKDEGGKSSTTLRSRKPTIKVLERVKAFKAENPSYFWVTMYPSYIKGNMLVSFLLIDLVSVKQN